MRRLLKNRYEIIGILGRGGMGRVYKVADRARGNMVLAAKELKQGKASDHHGHDALLQFRSEARILMGLTHRNLPKVHDFFQEQGAHYLVMEHIRGRTLEQIITARKGKPMDERLTLSWALQICRTMHFLSVQKPRPIVFRDLKPSNIMIDRKGRIKLIDFGIARFFKEDQREDTYVYGTPGYAAPEQYGTGQTDVRSDLYSLGATLHHCLTGRAPSAIATEFTDPRRINPGLGKETAAIVRKALDRDREKRFRSASEMKIAIQKVLLAQAERRGKQRIIMARPGMLIRLPWRDRFAWVSIPSMSLGCSGSAGTLSIDDRWMGPKSQTFGPDAARLLFRIESSVLSSGRKYQPRITVRTDEGILHPRLLIRRSWPWMEIVTFLLGAVIVAAALLRLR